MIFLLKNECLGGIHPVSIEYTSPRSACNLFIEKVYSSFRHLNFTPTQTTTSYNSTKLEKSKKQPFAKMQTAVLDFYVACATICVIFERSSSFPAPVSPETGITFPSPSERERAISRTRSLIFIRESLSLFVAITVNGII